MKLYLQHSYGSHLSKSSRAHEQNSFCIHVNKTVITVKNHKLLTVFISPDDPVCRSHLIVKKSALFFHRGDLCFSFQLFWSTYEFVSLFGPPNVTVQVPMSFFSGLSSRGSLRADLCILSLLISLRNLSCPKLIHNF